MEIIQIETKKLKFDPDNPAYMNYELDHEITIVGKILSAIDWRKI